MDTTAKKKSIIYARVSTAIQDTDRQVVDLTAYANGNGYSVERIFTEKISGAKKNKERHALMDALNYATRHKCTILCSELSRLGRNIDEILKSILFCKEHKTNVFFQKEQLSIFNTDGNEHPFLMIMIAILGTCAKLEREAIRFRMKSGYDKFRAEGGKVGRKTGYRMTLEDYEKRYPRLMKDLRKKLSGCNSRRYWDASLARRHHVSVSTVQHAKKKLLGKKNTKSFPEGSSLALGYSDSNQE